MKIFFALAVFLMGNGFCFGEGKSENLLKNGGFEETSAITEQDWMPFQMKGWRLSGAMELPSYWDLKIPIESERWLPGYVEVIKDQSKAKEGNNFLKITTKEGWTFLRTAISQEIQVPESNTIEWSFWVRGHFGLNEKSDKEGVPNWIFFQYLTQKGLRTTDAGQASSTREWTQRQGKVYLEGCTGKAVFAIVSYCPGFVPHAASYFDGICLKAVPRSPEAVIQDTQKPSQTNKTVQLPLISRPDYKAGTLWQLPLICGKDFWFIFPDSSGPNALYPRLSEIFKHSGCISWRDKFPDLTKFGTNAPFMLEGLRWGAGDYHDLAQSMYSMDAAKVVSYRPRQTLNDIKGNNLDGWKSSGKLPQSILYDFYDETFIDSVRVFPAFGNNRETRYQLEVSRDGKAFTMVGEKKGPTTREGHQFQVKDKTVYVRLTVLADSSNQAQILETEFSGENGQSLKPLVVSTTSEALPVAPTGMVSMVELRKALKEKYGERFLGFRLSEWDNDMGPTLLDGYRHSRSKEGPAAFRRRQDLFPFRFLIPKDHQETYANLCQGFAKVMETYGGDTRNGADVIAMSSWNPWQHYACELGSSMSCIELANCEWPMRTRALLMFSRSAARQYQKPWFVYFTSGFLGFIHPLEHFEAKKKAGIFKGSQPNTVLTSESLFFRDLMLSYMMGCNLYQHENEGWLGDEVEIAHRGLTGFGRNLIKTDEFIHKLKERGTPYTPVAFCVDYMHGLAMHNPWGHPDEETRSDRMCLEVLDAILPYKDNTYVHKPPYYSEKEDDNLRLVNSHCGDVFDVLIPNPPGRILSQDQFDCYKAIVLLGRINLTPELGERLKQFVRNGGTLVINSAYLGDILDKKFTGVQLLKQAPEPSQNAFDETGNKLESLKSGDTQNVSRVELADGARILAKDEKNPLLIACPREKGLVITCTVPEMLSEKQKLIPAAVYVLERLHDETIPFRVEGDIEFLFNQVSDGWLVTLLNNRGVFKEPMGPMCIDEDKTAKVTIFPRETLEVVGVSELMEENIPSTEKKGDRIVSATVYVPPGDVRVVKILLKK